MRHIFVIIGTLLSTVSVSYCQAPTPTQTEITVTYYGNVVVSGPPPQRSFAIHHQFDIVLSNRNQVKERHVWGGGNGEEDQKLGNEKFGKTELPESHVWRVLPGNKLVRISYLPQSTETIEVAISGTQCTAKVTEQLKPGFKEFEITGWQGETVFLSSRDITSTSCSIK